MTYLEMLDLRLTDSVSSLVLLFPLGNYEWFIGRGYEIVHMLSYQVFIHWV